MAIAIGKRPGSNTCREVELRGEEWHSTWKVLIV
jgi:hypothetical protein